VPHRSEATVSARPVRAPRLQWTLTLALLGAAVAGGCSERPHLAGSFDLPAPDSGRVLKVTGSGRMSLPPSQVNFECVVRVCAPTADAAWGQSSARIVALSKALEKAGVPAGELVMRGIAMVQQSPQGPEAWCLMQRLSVTLTELARLPALVSVVLGAGADGIENARFGISDTRTAGDRARERALVDAATKAEMLAQEVNLRLGAVRSVEERAFSADGVPGSVDAPPGDFEVVTSLEVTYELID